MKCVFLLAGGRPPNRKDQTALIRMVFRETGKERPELGYIGVASGDDTRFMGMMQREFNEFGIRMNHAVIARPDADLAKARDILRGSDVIFMGGGDVEAGMQVLLEKQMVEFLRGLYREGKVFFGISAGSIMLANKWVRWFDPDDDSTAGLFNCLDIASVICDTHDEASGFEELQAAIALEQPGVTGYGLASNTGLKVYPDGKVEAIGGPVWRLVKKSGKVVREADLVPVPS